MISFDTEKEVKEFLDIVESCEGDVYISSDKGDVYNLKSEMSKYIALGAMIRNEHENLELRCDKKEDGARFFKLFAKTK